MKTHPKPVVGQVLFHVQRGYRNNGVPKLGIATVTNVGRKYFSVEYGETHKFSLRRNLSDWSSADNYYNSPDSLYLSEQHYRDELEARELRQEIRRLANNLLADVALPALREVVKYLRREKL